MSHLHLSRRGLLKGGVALGAGLAAPTIFTGQSWAASHAYTNAPQGSTDVVAFNGSGRAPAAATLEKLTELGVTELEQTSPHAVIVPGAVDAWCRLNADHGRLPLAELLQPAIDLARNGYPVTQRLYSDFCHLKNHIKSNANLSEIFLQDGDVPAFGSLHLDDLINTNYGYR